MSEMHDHLATERYLKVPVANCKHTGRLQFQLFLRSIGLSFEGAIAFWSYQVRQSPASGEKFDDEYRNDIERTYFRDGKKTDHVPLGCLKIINSGQALAQLIPIAPGPAEKHGCPFRQHDASKLAEMMQRQGISEDEIKSIIEKARDHHFQIACQLHFKARHRGSEQDNLIIMHPDEYYLESLNYQAKRN